MREASAAVAVVAGVAGDDVLEGALVVSLLAVGLREEALDAVRGSVAARSRAVRAMVVVGMPLDARDVPGIEGACAVGVDARSATERALGDDVDRGAGVGEEVQGGRGAAARQRRARPAREHGRHPPALRSQARVAVARTRRGAAAAGDRSRATR